MTWRDAVSAWTTLEARRPVAWRAGVAGLLGSTGALVLSVLGTLPAVPEGPRLALTAALAVLAVFLGRRVFWNDAERRLRTLWRLVGFNGLVILLGLAGQKAGLPLSDGGMVTTDSSVMRSAALSLFLVLTLAALLATRLLDRRSVRELGIVPGPGFWGDLGFGMGLGVLLMVLIFGVELMAGWVAVVDVARAGAGASSFAHGFLNMGLVFLAVGFYEELVNRGYLLRALAQGFVGRWLSPTWAIVLATFLSSAVFGLGHLGNPHANWVSTFNIVMAGILLALPYVLTGRLAASVGLHITWNLFQGSVFGFAVSGLNAPATLLAIEQGGPTFWTGGEFGPEAGMVGLLAMLLGAALIVGRERLRQKPLRLHAELVRAPAATGVA